MEDAQEVAALVLAMVDADAPTEDAREVETLLALDVAVDAGPLVEDAAVPDDDDDDDDVDAASGVGQPASNRAATMGSGVAPRRDMASMYQPERRAPPTGMT